jgi:hypothetical protein
MKNALYLLLLALIVGGIYYFSQQNDTSSLGDKGLTDFAITDTSSIGKVIIDDGRNIVELKRGEGRFWTMDDTYIAMPHHIDVILKTFANVGIQSPVSKIQKESVIKIILGDTRKVAIYDRSGKWLKTWYVGRATKTNQGTFALLETPEDGLSTEPYVIEMRGFRGYLTTRFHAIINDWRWTGLFYYPELDFKSILVETPQNPELGFKIDVESKMDGAFTVYDIEGNPLDLNKASVASYLGRYKEINVEHFVPKITLAQEDSIRATPPSFRITVTGKDEKKQSADIWYRPTPEALIERMGTNAPDIDPERVFVYFNDDMAMGQRLTFDKILFTRQDF